MSLSEGFKIGSQLGYGMSGRAKEDKEVLRRQLQLQTSLNNAQINDYNAKTSKTEEEIRALRDQNSLSQMQLHMIQNQMAAKDLDLATDELVTNGNYEAFNKTVKTNPVILEKMQKNYGVSSIRPIDWDNKEDLAQLQKAGLDEQSIQLAKEDKGAREGINRAFYMTDAGHLTSLDDFIQHTGYINRATSDKFKAYVDMKNQLANIGKKLSINEVQAEDAKNWLVKNPDKTYMDYLNIKKPPVSNSRRDALEQYTTAFKQAHPNATPEQFQEAMAKFVNAKGEGVGSNRENADVSTVKAKANIKEPKEKEAFNAEIDILTSLKQTDKTKYDLVNRNIKTMDVNYQLATNIDKVLKGPAQKINTNAIQAAKDKLHKWFGIKDETTVDNAIFKTKGGALLATYILSRSGTAASDNERAFLQDLMMSGNLDDEKYVRNSLKAFEESLAEQNQTAAKAIQEYAPYSAKKYSLSQQEAQATTKSEVVKQVIYQGKTYNVDADGNMTEVTE